VVQAYARVGPLTRRPPPQARAPQQAEAALQTQPVGRSPQACLPRRWRYTRLCRRSSKPRRPTLASQVAAWRARVAADGLAVAEAMPLLDEGDRGAPLVRPALERLRDVRAAGRGDRLYVPAPDRLARQYAYQVPLVDELRRVGVAVLFLTRALGQSREDDLVLQGQGRLAANERAKLMERQRRGTRHAARIGAVNGLRGAP